MPRVLGRFKQQPADKLDYDFLFAQWLAQRRQHAVSHTATLEGDAILHSSVLMHDAVKVIVRGGTSGKSNKVTVTLRTDGGLIKQAEILVKVKEI